MLRTVQRYVPGVGLSEVSLIPLTKKGVFLFDLDGTIYKDGEIFVDVLNLLEYLKAHHQQYFFLTNNSSKSKNQYYQRLKKLGIKLTKKQVLTSTDIAILYIKEKYINETFFVVGTKAMKIELSKAGIKVSHKKEDCRGVIVGNDTQLTFKKLNIASELLTKGAIYLATNPDFVCPVKYGYVPDAGSILFGLYKATGRKAIILGKPYKGFYHLVKKLTKARKDEIVMIGDRLYTDIKFATSHGLTSILVLSGEATMNEVNKSKIRVDYIVNDLSHLYQCLKK